MNLFKALGSLLLVTSILIFLFTYEAGDLSGPLEILGNLAVPILCFIAGVVLLVKGFLFKPPTVKTGGTNRTASKAKKKKKKKKK